MRRLLKRKWKEHDNRYFLTLPRLFSTKNDVLYAEVDYGYFKLNNKCLILKSTESQERLEVPLFEDEELLVAALKSYKDKSSSYLQQLEQKTSDEQNFDNAQFLNLLNNVINK